MDIDDWIPLAFASIAAMSVLAYVLMDGWDLGVGILYPLVARDHDREVMLNSIAPFWDANETWLVFGGMMLLVGFPLAYATLLSSLYIPLMLMLMSLILRGVAYEFRHHGGVLKKAWGAIFSVGSILAALSQGWMLGLIVGGAAAGSASRPADVIQIALAVTGALGLVGGYALLGCCWLVLKCEGPLQTLGREVGHSALLLALLLLAAASIWTPLMSPQVAARWFSANSSWMLWIVPLATLYSAWRTRAALWSCGDGRPLIWAVTFFVGAFCCLGISLFPYIVPYQHSLFEVANDIGSLRFASVGVMVILPITIAYLLLGYRVFRGKARPHGADPARSPHIGSRRCTGPSDLHMS
jgi:cytochrome d ubiquinol oxidase subunit II